MQTEDKEIADTPSEEVVSWSWNTAVEKAEALVDEIAVPWGDLAITDIDIGDGNLMLFSEKLARTSFYIVQVNNRLTRLLAVNAAVKDTLDHAVNRSLGNDDNGKRAAIAVKVAAVISKDKRLRDMKIQLIESTAAIKALESVKSSLDTLWKTTSRIVSARLKEPID